MGVLMGCEGKNSRVQERRRIGTRRSAAALALVAALAALPLGGCGVKTGVKAMFGMDEKADFASPEARTASGASIAVLPFENLTTHQNAGTIMSDLLTTELYRLGGLKVMESSRTRSLLAGAYGDDGRGETAYAQEVGRKLGVQNVMLGSVSEYGYQYGLREEPVVGVNIRVVRVSDGAVIWATSDSDIGSSFWSRESVNDVALRVAGRTAERLGKAISPPQAQPNRSAATSG